MHITAFRANCFIHTTFHNLLGEISKITSFASLFIADSAVFYSSQIRTIKTFLSRMIKIVSIFAHLTFHLCNFDLAATRFIIPFAFEALFIVWVRITFGALGGLQEVDGVPKLTLLANIWLRTLRTLFIDTICANALKRYLTPTRTLSLRYED